MASYQAMVRDRVRLMIAFREADGTYRPVGPLDATPGDPVPEGHHVFGDGDATLDIPRELAEALLSALARYLIGAHGDADLLATLRRTERERDDARRQLDKLIDGIGRLGGNRS